ncbi:MAG: glycosyltransferase family 4 protein [Salinisphaera sp.]|nr:glycosyltransferase family 4 protein [Salinisphaera sp.]
MMDPSSPLPRMHGDRHGRPLRVAMLARSAELFGAERSLFRLAVGFAQWPEFQPLVIVPGDGSLRARCRAYGVDTALVAHQPWRRDRRGRWARLNRHAANLRAWPRLLRRLQRFGPDVILSSTAQVTVGALAAHRLGVPHAWRLHEMNFAAQRPALDLGWWLTRRFLRTPGSRLVAVSRAVRDDFQALVGRDDMVAIHEGFDFPPVPEPPSRHHPQPGNAQAVAPLELLCLGSLGAGKGIEDALRAAADLVRCGHQIRLRIVGEGDPVYLARLHQLSGRLRLNSSVSFSGFVHDTARLFRRAQITLVCGRNEGFGRAAVESLAHGTPVIAVDGGGLPEIVRPGRTGLLYPAGDWRALRDRIAALGTDEELYSQIATTGVAWVRQRFPARRFVREMGEVLTQAALIGKPELQRELSTQVQPLPCALPARGLL